MSSGMKMRGKSISDYPGFQKSKSIWASPKSCDAFSEYEPIEGAQRFHYSSISTWPTTTARREIPIWARLSGDGRQVKLCWEGKVRRCSSASKSADCSHRHGRRRKYVRILAAVARRQKSMTEVAAKSSRAPLLRSNRRSQASLRDNSALCGGDSRPCDFQSI